MSTFETIMATASHIWQTLRKKANKIARTDRIILACTATGILFVLFALIQIIMILVGGLHVGFDNVMLIITDIGVAGIAGFLAMQRQEALRRERKKAKRRQRQFHARHTNQQDHYEV